MGVVFALHTAADYVLCPYAGPTYPIVLTIVHTDGTSILSLQTSRNNSSKKRRRAGSKILGTATLQVESNGSTVAKAKQALIKSIKEIRELSNKSKLVASNCKYFASTLLSKKCYGPDPDSL